MHDDFFALHSHIGDSIVLEGCKDGQVAGVEEIPAVGENMAGCGQGPDLLAGDQTKGFGGDSGGAAEGDLEKAGEQGFGFGLSMLGAVS